MSIDERKGTCGVVMPISAIDGCTEAHWSDVLEILTEAIEEADFEANLVSNADDVGIIHKRIIQNLYDNPIVVCDVSGKNPNVMFELGMRLAFDKPTIIVKDDKTTYSFDTSAIEHLEYPRDLRFTKIVEFKQKLTDKINATHSRATSDNGYTTFLKHFGEFKVAKIDQKEISGQEFILEELKSLRYSMRRLERTQLGRDKRSDFLYREKSLDADINICMGGWSSRKISEAYDAASEHPAVLWVELIDRGEGHQHLIAKCEDGADIEEIEKTLGGRTRRGRPQRVKKNEDNG